METTNEGIWVSDATGKTTYANKRMAEMLGYRREDLTGKYGLEFADEEYSAISKANMEKRRQGINSVHEFKFITERWLTFMALVNSQALFDTMANLWCSCHVD